MRKLAAVAVMVSALAACGTSKTEPSGPSVSIAKAVPATVKGNTVSLDLAAAGLQIVKADGDTTGKTGHYHVFLDRDPVATGEPIPRERGVVHAAASPVLLTGLSVGAHKIVVVLGDGAHRRIGTSQAAANVTVEGPSIRASAPATVAAGQAVAVAVTAEGVSIVKADGDTSGKTGHYHVFVDREPTAAGQAIPKEAGIIHSAEGTVSVTGLTAGEHTLWVVLGDGVHRPFEPRVLDKVTVTVS